VAYPRSQPLTARQPATVVPCAHLQTVQRKPSTIKTVLAAPADFYTRRGLGVPDVPGLDLSPAAPRALQPRQATEWLRAVQRCPNPRDRVLALIPFYAGLRIGETVALDVDDVRVSARKGLRVAGAPPGARPPAIPGPAAPRARPRASAAARSRSMPSCARTSRPGWSNAAPGPAPAPTPPCSSTSGAAG